jgi:hypothetical protein
MIQRARISQIGMLLTVVGVGFAFLWWYSVGYLFPDWHWFPQISALTFTILMACPPIALTISGFMLYVTGRKAFWATAHQLKSLLGLLGLALMTAGGFFVTWFWAYAAYAANKPGQPYSQPLSYYLAINSPYFVLFALWIASGLLIFADAIEAMLATRRKPDPR